MSDREAELVKQRAELVALSERLASGYAELESIVRDLVALKTFKDDFGYAFECRCPTRFHEPTCPYRRAKDWVADHPESTDA